MVAGFVVSLCAIDFSPMTGKLAAGLQVLAGLTCLLLPVTHPGGSVPQSLGEALGFGALKLLKSRDQLVYFLCAFLFSIPITAFYLHTPLHFKELGVTRISALMSLGQFVEAIAMFGMGVVMMKYRVKTILCMAMLAGVFRYAFCASDQVACLIIGVMLHGICWTFFYEAGRVYLDRIVDAGMKGQAQALLNFFTSGLAGIIGVLVVKALFAHFVEGEGDWSNYWMTLSGICMVSFLIFKKGYRG